MANGWLIQQNTRMKTRFNLSYSATFVKMFELGIINNKFKIFSTKMEKENKTVLPNTFFVI